MLLSIDSLPKCPQPGELGTQSDLPLEWQESNRPHCLEGLHYQEARVRW